ncbi:MAG: DNA adenine methylase [Planctomycetota bacterium]|jgi:adenine-specific DNA-methyltransferase
MRYLGSKRKLLPQILRLAREQGVPEKGRVFDIFAGTACVGRCFKEAGFSVVTNDRMHLSYVLQRALVQCDEAPGDLAERAAALESARRMQGLVTRQYSPLGEAGRRFFHPDPARRIDGALALLRRWRASGEVTEEGFYLLLAAVLEGASSIANISGTFGAYLKSWQPNAERPLKVRPTAPVASAQGARPSVANRCDGNELVREVEADLLYIDPPYNGREYSANYHVLEAIARAGVGTRADRAALEKEVYGKTGLLRYERSAYCSTRRVAEAFRDLIAASRARHVIVSYSEEGLLSEGELREALAAGVGAAPSAVTLRCIDHKRFRSDRDRAGDGRKGTARSYKQVEGRTRDALHEWLLHVERPAVSFHRTGGGRLRSHEAERSPLPGR